MLTLSKPHEPLQEVCMEPESFHERCLVFSRPHHDALPQLDEALAELLLYKESQKTCREAFTHTCSAPTAATELKEDTQRGTAARAFDDGGGGD